MNRTDSQIIENLIAQLALVKDELSEHQDDIKRLTRLVENSGTNLALQMAGKIDSLLTQLREINQRLDTLERSEVERKATEQVFSKLIAFAVGSGGISLFLEFLKLIQR